MNIQCPECSTIYDDVDRWTICPHAPIDSPYYAYCQKCDLRECIQPENHLKISVDDMGIEALTSQQLTKADHIIAKFNRLPVIHRQALIPVFRAGKLDAMELYIEVLEETGKL